MRAGGQAAPKFDGSVVGQFVFDGGIELTPTRLAVTDFRMTMGAETAIRHAGRLDQGAAPSLQGRVALPKIDLEKWLAACRGRSVFLPAQPNAQAPGKDSPAKAPAPGKPASPFTVPVAMDVSLALDVAEVMYRKGMVRDVAVALEIHKGVITVPQLQRRLLPGDMRVQATAVAAAAAGQVCGRRRQAGGALSVSGPRLRETLAWLEIDPSGVPSDKLQTLRPQRQDRRGAATVVQIVDVVAQLDGERATGSGSVTFGTPSRSR